MKQGKPVITFAILILAAALAVYFGCHLFSAFDTPYRTIQAYAYTAYDSAPAEGLVIRQARVLAAPSGILEITRAEGEKVGAGQQIALVYRDSQAQASQAQIEELQMEIELLENAIQGGDVESAARLDEDVLESVAALRASYAQGDFTRLREQTMAVKSNVLKRGYTYGEGLTSDDLKTRLQLLSSQLTVLNQQSARATTRVTAPEPGVFSALVDGYESQLTPETVGQLTPSALQNLIDTPAGEDSASLGKLITSDTWYFAANLPAVAARRLEKGQSATLRFSGELNRDVPMTVNRIGATEGGQTLVVFSCNRYLTLTTLLRHQTAELIFSSWSGLRIPKEALRLEEIAPESTSSSSVSADPVQKLGVYAMINGRSEFREVEIAYEGSDYYVVRSLGSGRRVLRSGDAVLVEGVGLQDGLRLEG